MAKPRKNQLGRDEQMENPLMVILGDKSSKEEKQEEAKEQRKNFVETQKAVISQIGDRIKTMTKSIVRAITGKSSFLSKVIKGLVLLIPSLFLSAADGLNKILDLGTVGFGKLSTLFSEKLPAFVKRLDTLVDLAKTKFLGIFSSVGPAIVKRFSAIFGGLKETKIGKMIANFGTKLQPVFTLFTNVFNRLKPIMSVFSGFFATAGRFASFAGSVFGGISKGFQFLSKFLKPVLNVISKVSKFFKAIPILGQIITAVEGIIGFFRGFLGTEGSLMDKLINGIKGFFAQIISGFTFGLVSFDEVMGYIDGFIDGVANIFTGGLAFFTETIPSLFDSMVTGIGNFFSNIGTFFSETVPNFFVGLYESFVHFHAVTLPNFFTKTIPDFFMNFGSRISEYLDMAGSFLYDIFVQPWIDLGGFIGNMFMKAKNMILDGLISLVNTFNYGGVLDSAIETLEGFKTQADIPTGTTPSGGFDPVAIQEKVRGQLETVANRAKSAIAQRDQVIMDLQRQLADKVGGAVNVISTTNNTTSYPTDSEPASEVDPTLRRAVQPMPY